MNIEEFQALVAALEPLVNDVTTSAIVIACIYVAFSLLIELLLPLVVVFVSYKIALMVKEWSLTKKTTIVSNDVHVSIEDKIISTDKECFNLIKEAFDLCHQFNGSFNSSFMHKEHAEFLRDAAKEKLDRESQAQPTTTRNR